MPAPIDGNPWPGEFLKVLALIEKLDEKIDVYERFLRVEGYDVDAEKIAAVLGPK